MAFHVSCPITCRKICFCALGFAGPLRSEKGKENFLQEVFRVEQFLKDPWLIKAKENATVQVKVPKVVSSAPKPPPLLIPADVSAAANGGAEEASAQVKRAELQKQAAAASLAAEDYARMFESGDLEVSASDAAGEEQGLSNAKVMCRLCFSGENEGSQRARKMVSCNSCGKKYHRSCLKSWSRNRDLFHWSSWSCPSCRICEVCRRTGDPNKFMFCKRCDGAYHCYCQHPPHKNVSHGPYLCSKHTKCYSCGSTVPGNGLSVRWLLGYTCCDACGRLFSKGNYCPICLKVYRDSESTPMVCCDICQRWVHCPCDGISDAKYMQFQVDGNLQYVCATCRGECPQIRNLEEAVQELWRRRDEADKDLIASLRAAAGLPTQEEIFDMSPFSDDEESGPPSVKNEYGRSLKFSLKGMCKKSPKKSESAANEAAASKHKYVDEVSATNITKASRTIKIKSNKSHGMTGKEEIGSIAHGPKLVIHLGGRRKNTSPPRFEASSFKKAQEKTSSKGHKRDHADQMKGSKMQGKEGPSIKLRNAASNSEFSNISSKHSGGGFNEGYESVSPKNTHSVLGKRNAEDSSSLPSVSTNERTPFLKFKIPKNSTNGNQNDSNKGNQDSLPPTGKGEIIYTRGQRSKRRRPSTSDEYSSQKDNDSTLKDFTYAYWILQKLGKDAAGKRVEVHQPTSNSWHKGTVVEVFEGTSTVSIALDDGKAKSFELGKQGIRFISQKQKH